MNNSSDQQVLATRKEPGSLRRKKLSCPTFYPPWVLSIVNPHHPARDENSSCTQNCSWQSPDSCTCTVQKRDQFRELTSSYFAFPCWGTGWKNPTSRFSPLGRITAERTHRGLSQADLGVTVGTFLVSASLSVPLLLFRLTICLHGCFISIIFLSLMFTSYSLRQAPVFFFFFLQVSLKHSQLLLYQNHKKSLNLHNNRTNIEALLCTAQNFLDNGYSKMKLRLCLYWWFMVLEIPGHHQNQVL